jgi:hypothetical protein
LGQFSQAENTGVPGFEQSFLKRCTTIKVWLEIKEAFGGNAALKKHFYASSSGGPEDQRTRSRFETTEGT